MRPNLEGIAGARLMVIIVALLAATVLMLRSLGTREPIATTAEKRLEAAELERESTAARATAVVSRAAEARVATKPAVARANALHERVHVVRGGQLLVEDADAGRSTLVPVPSVVTERIQADSVAISALSVALTLDSTAMAAQEERFVAEAKVRAAAHLTIAALKHERQPRCGRGCGMVLGAVSVVALGIALR